MCRKELKSLQEAQHKCPSEGCTKSFANAYNLRRHMKSSHSGLARYGCAECKEVFRSYQELRAHEQEHSHSSLNGGLKTALIESQSEIEATSTSGNRKLRTRKAAIVANASMKPEKVTFYKPNPKSHRRPRSTKNSKDHTLAVTMIATDHDTDGKLIAPMVSKEVPKTEKLIDLANEMEGLPSPIFNYRLPMPMRLVRGCSPREYMVDEKQNLCFLNMSMF